MNIPQKHSRAFSLIEVLLAVFILGIGLIMVASVFPVAADWTRQSTEDTIAQTVALSAVSLIKDSYSPSSLNTATKGRFSTLSVPASTAVSPLQPLPALTSIPITERTYLFGSSTPFPTSKPESCSYFWTALARVQPGQPAGAGKAYDLYILVFRKGDPGQQFTAPSTNAAAFPGGEFLGLRDAADLTNPTMNHLLEPTMLQNTYNDGSSPPTPACPPLGFIGIGLNSGTVFRQGFDSATSKAVSRPGVITAGEPILYPLPADGTTTSPLIYVYQTTITF